MLDLLSNVYILQLDNLQTKQNNIIVDTPKSTTAMLAPEL